MNYTLNPERIDINLKERKEDCLGYGMPSITMYQAVAEYTIIKSSGTYIVTTESDFHTNKEAAIKEAVEKLEWNVYYHKICNNFYNKSKEL